MAAARNYRGRTGMSHVEEELGRADASITGRLGRVLGVDLGRTYPQTARDMLAGESARRQAGGEYADLLVARDIIRAHLDGDLVKVAVAEARERIRVEAGVRNVKHVGWRLVTVRLPHGDELRLLTPYVRPTRKGMVGRPRGTGKRREGGAGAFPVLERLGVLDRVTPLTRSDIARQTVLCSSYAEALEQLARGGLTIDESTLTLVAVRTGQQALSWRDAALAEAREAPLPDISPLAGKRVRVSLDGGRARTRETHTRARTGENGRRPFTLSWREPRLITIDVLDEKGKVDRDWRPIYETTLGDADTVFALLTGLLRLLGVHLALEVVFLADGAQWIWDRLDPLIADVGLAADKTYKVLDYYHATEHVADALRACKNLSQKRRKELFDNFRKDLVQPGGPTRVVKALRSLARGRRGRLVNKEVRYLEKHLRDMDYAAIRALKLPIGSGVVESAVRRVLNLRFKSASACWDVEHLEALLNLRAIAKSGRWDQFMDAWLDQRHWLQPLDYAGSPDTGQAV